MSAPRKTRLAQNIRDLLAEMIDQELKDPRVHGAGFVGVNHVELDAGAASAAMAGLETAAGFLRGNVGRRLGLKRAPELRFIHDDSPDMQVRLSEIVRDDARSEGGDD